MARPRLTLLLVIVVALATLTVTPTQAARSKGDGGAGDLRFRKPVSMRSFAPLRTAVSAAYSLRRGREPEEHEWSGEPVIAVNEHGDIFIAGTCCVGPAAPVWVSRNGGRSFRELKTPRHVREYGIGAEGTIAVDDAGSIYFVDTFVAGLMVTRWHDRGRTWDFTMPAVGVIPGFDDRPWISYSEENLYLYVNHVSHTQIYRSPDGGVTWLTAGPLTWNGSPAGQPYFPGHIAAHRASGDVWVGGIVSSGDEEVLGATVSRDEGATFTEAVVTKPQREDGFSPIFTGIMAVDDAGNGYISWSTWDKKGCDVYYAASTDRGKSWGKPVKVNRGPGCATFPWIAAGADGRLAVAWYETPQTEMVEPEPPLVGEPPEPAFQDAVPPDTRWYIHAATVTRAHSKNPVIEEARVATPTPVIDGPLERKPWDFLQVDIGPGGRMHITYAEKWKSAAPETWYTRNTSGPRLR